MALYGLNMHMQLPSGATDLNLASALIKVSSLCVQAANTLTRLGPNQTAPKGAVYSGFIVFAFNIKSSV